jgi:arginase family enzyme
VVWFDAHGDLNTPSSSPSGAFHGMVLRNLLGTGFPEMSPSQALRPSQVVLAGVRALDPAEKEYVEEAGIAHVEPAALASLPSVIPAEATALYLHIDLDVLDPESFAAVGTPEPAGVTPEQLVAAVRALSDRWPVAGLGITEYEPDRPSDRAVLAALVPALLERAL